MSRETSAGIREEFVADRFGDKPMINNKVLVEIDFVPKDGTVLDSGIILAGEEWDDAGRVARYGTVKKAPRRLIGSWQNSFEGAMNWKTEVEVKEGDTVFFGKMESANAPALFVGGKLYYIMNYSELILRVRDDVIYPLNGNIIVKQIIEKTRVDGLKLDFSDHRNDRLGEVVYVGRKNDFYHGSKMKDADVQVGDTIIFMGDWYTEIENKVFARLEEGLGYIQGSWVIGKL